MTKPTTPIKTRIGSLLLAVLLVTALAGAVAAPAAAQEEDDGSWTDGLFEDTARSIGDHISEIAGSLARGYEKRFGEDPGTNASQNVRSFAATFNDLAATDPTFGDYAEGRIEATDDRLTYEVTCSDRDGNQATMYVVADRNDTKFVNERMVTPSEFEDMDRTVDYWIEADWYACENAEEELNKFYDNFVLPDKDVSTSEKARIRAQYMSGVETNLWGDVNETSS